MLFDVWGSDTLIHWAGWAMVFIGLIVLNEVGRRTKLGAAIIFGVAPLAMTIYCVAIAVGVSQGAEWALTNPTHVYQNSWFHYAKVYAASAGCWGFIAIKYQWGKIGRAHWFTALPFVIVAINIMIAVVSDFESAIAFAWASHLGHVRRCYAVGRLEQRVQRHRRYHQHLLHDRLVRHLHLQEAPGYAVARHDVGLHHRLRHLELLLHLQLPAHPLLVLRLCAAAGAHRRRLYLEQGRLGPEPRLYAGHLVHVCQVFPYFQEESIFVTHSTLDPGAATAVSIAALVANVAAIIYIAYRAKKLGRNPYKQDVFEGTSDWEKATARRAKVDYAHASNMLAAVGTWA